MHFLQPPALWSKNFCKVWEEQEMSFYLAEESSEKKKIKIWISRIPQDACQCRQNKSDHSLNFKTGVNTSELMKML